MSVQPTAVARFRAGVRAAIEATLNAQQVKDALGFLDPLAVVPMPVLEGRNPSAWYGMNLAGDESIVFSYAGEPEVERGPVGRRDRQGFVYRASIAICAANWADPVGAVYKSADIAEYLRGSSTLPTDVPNLRTQVILTVNGQDLYLRFVSTTPTIAPASTPNGGKFAHVQVWETTPEVRM